MRSKLQFSYRRGLTAKMIGMSLLLGVLIWMVAQAYETQALRAAFEEHLRVMLDDQAREDRLDFDRFGESFQQVAQLIVGQQKFHQYFSAAEHRSRVASHRVWSHSPPWFVSRSAQRALVTPRCALLFNQRRELLELFSRDHLNLPAQLLAPSPLLVRKSHGQTFLTLVEGVPYMLSAATTEVAGAPLTLLLVSPIDEFLLMSLNVEHERLMALISLNDQQVLVSSNLSSIPPGASLKALARDYVISDRSFHDNGGAEMMISLSSFLPRSEMAQMKEAFIEISWLQRTLSAMVLLLGPIPIIIWVSSRIRRLTDKVRGFSRETLRAEKVQVEKGDELSVLDDNVTALMVEVLESHKTIRDETLKEARMQIALAQQEKQLEQLLLVTEALHVGVMREGQELKAENGLMSRWAEIFGGLEPFRSRVGESEQRTIQDLQGNAFVFQLQAMCLNEGERVVLVSDLTAQIKAENDKQRLQAELLQAQKMESIGRLAGGVAHDFNNILTAITGNLHLMGRRMEAESPLRKYMQVIDDAGRKGADLTRQLLGFSRKQIVDPKPRYLNDSIESLSQMLRRLIGENIAIDSSLQPALWPVVIDQTQVEQVIMNLVINARDAMPDGGRLLIETSNVELSEDYARKHLGMTAGDYVCLAISDTGLGISVEHQKQIFEPFFTTKPKGEGTGLGLSMVYGIVKQNSGNIYVYSELGKGTSFRIYLPRSLEVVAEQPLEPLAREVPRGSETILLVEDDDGVRTFVVAVLSELGYTVLEAADGEEAIRSFDKYHGKIHLLLTDVVLPKMNGQKLAAALHERMAGLPVLYMSGYTQNAIVNQGVLAEGVNFLPKPLDLEDLAQAIRKVLGPKVMK